MKMNEGTMKARLVWLGSVARTLWSIIEVSPLASYGESDYRKAILGIELVKNESLRSSLRSHLSRLREEGLFEERPGGADKAEKPGAEDIRRRLLDIQADCYIVSIQAESFTKLPSEWLDLPEGDLIELIEEGSLLERIRSDADLQANYLDVGLYLGRLVSKLDEVWSLPHF